MRQGNDNYKIKFSEIDWDEVGDWCLSASLTVVLLGFLIFIVLIIRGCIDRENDQAEYIRKEAKEIYLGTLEKLDKKSSVTLTEITSAKEDDKFFLIINEKESGIGYGCSIYKRNLFISINDSISSPKVSFFSKNVYISKYRKRTDTDNGIDSIPSNILNGKYYHRASYSDRLMIIMRRQDIPLYIDKVVILK